MLKLGPNTFHVPAPGAMRSFALQQRILPVAGRIVGALAQFVTGAGTDVASLGDLNVLEALPKATPILGDVFASMSPGELEAVTRELLRDATVIVKDGTPKIPLFSASGADAFEGIMAGRTLDTWALLWHALEVWYPDFFDRARVLFARQAQANPSEASST